MLSSDVAPTEARNWVSSFSTVPVGAGGVVGLTAVITAVGVTGVVTAAVLTAATGSFDTAWVDAGVAFGAVVDGAATCS